LIKFIEKQLRENEEDESWRLRLKRDQVKMWTKEHSHGPISKGVVFSRLELEVDKSASLE